jgi:hypothetical protein
MANTVHIDEISEEQRRLLINNYFKAGKIELPSFTKGRIILVYAGVFLGIVLMFYLKKAVPTVIFCSSCFVFAFWHFYKFITPYFQVKRMLSQRPDDQQMISWLIKDLKNTVKPRSITTLGINISDVRPENFIIIPVPVYWTSQGIDSSHIMRAPLSDGTYLYTAWRVQILVLTKHYISLFKCGYDWLSNAISGISTNEFYFQDISSIRDDIREIEYSFIDNAEKKVGAGRVFCVTNFSGEYLTVINEIPSLAGPKNLSVNLEYIVSLLRMILRNRRFNISREVIPEKAPEQTEQSFEKEEKEKEAKIELINSIDYLMRNDVDGEDSPDSQFGNQARSSFDDGVDISSDGGDADLGGNS